MSDNPDLDALIHDLTQAGAVVRRQVRPVVARGALNIKRDWRRAASGIAHAQRYPESISYDLIRDGDSWTADIGPEDQGPGAGNQGFLGPVLEFGGAHNAPGNHGGAALDGEAPRFVETLTRLATGDL